MGRHIKTGEIITHTFHVPGINMFSYTYPQFPFINTHWFSEVMFYLLVTCFGFHGLLLFSTGVAILAFALIFFTALRQTSLFAVACVAFLYLGILAERTDVRPEIFSFLFCACFVTILYRYRQSFTPLIFFLPFIELIWVNTHIYFLVGIILLVLFSIDELFAKRNDFFGKKSIPRHTIYLLLVFLFTCFAASINPHGIFGALYPFFVMKNYGYSIQENQNIFFLLSLGSSQTITYFLFSASFLFFCLLVTIKKSRLIDWLLALTFTVLAITAIRNFILFVFITFFPFTYALTQVKNIIFQNFSARRSWYARIFFLFCFVCAIILGLYNSLTTHGFGWSVPSGAEPATIFFLKNNLRGPIYNNFDIGSYLDYSLYPKEKVFVDGRPEAYPASFFQNIYIPMEQRPEIFQKIDKIYHFNTIFFSISDQTPWGTTFLQTIVHNPNWHIVYLDDEIVILIKDTHENMKLIQKFGMTSKHLQIKHFPQNIQALYRLDNFFITAGWIDQEIKTDQAILSIDEKNCPALAHLISLYTQTDNQLKNIYLYTYSTVCQ